MRKLNKKTKVLIAGTAAAVAGATLIKMRKRRQTRMQEPSVPEPQLETAT